MGTFITGAVLLALVGLIVRSLAVNRRKGKSACGCGCDKCPSSSVCHK